jgi:hypothetical protein
MRARSATNRYSHLLFLSSFLLFALFSQPHRVHHTFERRPTPAKHSDHRDAHEQQRPKPVNTECPVFSVTQKCSLAPVELGEPGTVVLLAAITDRPAELWIERLTSASFYQRAPPPQLS